MTQSQRKCNMCFGMSGYWMFREKNTDKLIDKCDDHVCRDCTLILKYQPTNQELVCPLCKKELFLYDTNPCKITRVMVSNTPTSNDAFDFYTQIRGNNS
jgi:hypothetical protein